MLGWMKHNLESKDVTRTLCRISPFEDNMAARSLRLIFSIFMAQHKELKESVGLKTIDLTGAGAP